MEQLHKYVPKCQSKNQCYYNIMYLIYQSSLFSPVDGILRTLMFFGDQLTVERARASKKARIASDTAEEALDGLEPAAADWHAEANYVEVCEYNQKKNNNKDILKVLFRLCTHGSIRLDQVSREAPYYNSAILLIVVMFVLMHQVDSMKQWISSSLWWSAMLWLQQCISFL